MTARFAQPLTSVALAVALALTGHPLAQANAQARAAKPASTTASASNPQAAAPVTVRVTGLPADSRVYLFRAVGINQVRVDSAVAGANGSLTLGGRGKLTRGIYQIGVPGSGTQTPVLVSSEPTTVTVTHPAWAEARVTGGAEAGAYTQFRTILDRTQTRMSTIQDRYNARAKTGFGNILEQQEATTQARRAADSAFVSQDQALADLARRHPRTLAGKVSNSLQGRPTTTGENFFTAQELADPELLAPDILRLKIEMWLQRYVPSDLTAWHSAAGSLIEQTPAKSAARQAVYTQLTAIFFPFDQDFTRKLAGQFAAEYPNAPEAKQLLAAIPPGQPEIGTKAPDIILNDSAGNPMPLSEARKRHKLILIDFWASWCGPCRQENPTVVRAYEKYRDQGFTVYSVSLDNARGRWLAAIEKDRLTWPWHVSDLKGWQSEGAKLYRVNSIPASFLIDQTGTVIDRNLRGAALEAAIAKALGAAGGK